MAFHRGWRDSARRMLWRPGRGPAGTRPVADLTDRGGRPGASRQDHPDRARRPALHGPGRDPEHRTEGPHVARLQASFPRAAADRSSSVVMWAIHCDGHTTVHCFCTDSTLTESLDAVQARWRRIGHRAERGSDARLHERPILTILFPAARMAMSSRRYAPASGTFVTTWMAGRRRPVDEQFKITSPADDRGWVILIRHSDVYDAPMDRPGQRCSALGVERDYYQPCCAL